MHDVGNGPAPQFLERHTEIFQGLAIDELNLTGRSHESAEGLNVVGDGAKMLLAGRRLKPPRRTQGLFDPLPVLDIGACAAPFHDMPGCVGHGRSAEQEPAVLTVKAPQARFHFTCPARSQNGSPAFEQPRQVFGVDHPLPAPAIRFAEAKVRILAPALIEEVDVPVRGCSPYQTGNRVDDAAELGVHFDPSAMVAVM
jgi:hypothetical protein